MPAAVASAANAVRGPSEPLRADGVSQGIVENTMESTRRFVSHMRAHRQMPAPAARPPAMVRCCDARNAASPDRDPANSAHFGVQLATKRGFGFRRVCGRRDTLAVGTTARRWLGYATSAECPQTRVKSARAPVAILRCTAPLGGRRRTLQRWCVAGTPATPLLPVAMPRNTPFSELSSRPRAASASGECAVGGTC